MSGEPKPLLGRQYLTEYLVPALGLEGQPITRVVLDVAFDALVRVYVERWGDTRLLEVKPSLEGVQIAYAEPKS